MSATRHIQSIECLQHATFNQSNVCNTPHPINRMSATRHIQSIECLQHATFNQSNVCNTPHSINRMSATRHIQSALATIIHSSFEHIIQE
jgi:hypothetical protein